MLSGVQFDQGEHAAAIRSCTKSLDLYKKAKDSAGEGRAYSALGAVHLRDKHWAQARKAYERAISRSKSTNDDLDLWPAYLGLGRARRASGDLVGANDAVRRSLDSVERAIDNLTTDQGKVTLLDSTREAFDELISLNLENGDITEALAIAERSRGAAMIALRGARRYRGECSPVPTTQSELGPQLQGVGQGPQQARKGVPLGPRHPLCVARPMDDTQPPTPLARLVFHSMLNRLAVFAISNSGEIRVHTSPIRRELLTRRVEQLRHDLGVDRGGRGVKVSKATKKPPAEAYRAELRALYKDLIEPIESSFTKGEVIAIEPDGPLWLVPFAALEDQSGEPLIDRWPILYSH